MLLVLPGLAIYLFVILFPIGLSSVLSFTTWDDFKLRGFVGLRNYREILVDPGFHAALWHNVQIMLVSVFGQIPLGMLLAYILFRKMVTGAGFFEIMIFLPITISHVVVALLWNRIFSPVGLYTSLVRLLTDNPDYIVRIFDNPKLAMVPILFVLLWLHTGLYLVMFLANMQRIPTTIFDAAKIDGASEWTILTGIVLPALTNVIFTTAVFAIAGSLKSFDLVFAMTGGGPVNFTDVMSIYLYRHTFTYNNYGYGSAVSVLIVVLSVGCIGMLRWVYGRLQHRYE